MIVKRKIRVPKFLANGMCLACATALIFGIYPPAARAVYADGGNAVFVILATTWTRACALAVFCCWRQQRMFATSQHTYQAIVGGFYQTLSIFGIIGSLAFLPGPVVIIIIFSHTLMLLFYLAWRGETRLDGLSLVTTVLALIGLSLVVNLWHGDPGRSWLGLSLAALAAIATASRLYVYGHQTKTRHPAVVGAESFLVAALLTLSALGVQSPHPPLSMAGLGWTLICCASLAVGSFGMFYGIAWIGAFRWSLFSKLEPLFTTVFSVLLVHDILAPSQYLGIILVCASLASYQLMTHSRNLKLSRATAPMKSLD